MAVRDVYKAGIWPIGAYSSGTATMRNPTASGTHSTAPIRLLCISAASSLWGVDAATPQRR